MNGATGVGKPAFATSVVGVLLLVTVMVGRDFPAPLAAKKLLGQLNRGERVSIVSLTVLTSTGACGEYLVGDGPQRLRFMTSRQGTWAEQDGPTWNAPVKVGSLLTTAPKGRWDICEFHHSGRLGLFEPYILQFVTFVLNNS